MQSCFPAPCPPGSQPCFTCCALLRWCLAAGRQGVRLQVWHYLPLVPPEDAGGERDLHPPRLRQGQAPALHLLVSLGPAHAMRVGMLCGDLCLQALLTSVCNSSNVAAVVEHSVGATRSKPVSSSNKPEPHPHTAHITFAVPPSCPRPFPCSKGCLLNRHGEDMSAAAASGCWVCPCCRGSCGAGCIGCCNCGPCRKKVSGLAHHPPLAGGLWGAARERSCGCSMYVMGCGMTGAWLGHSRHAVQWEQRCVLAPHDARGSSHFDHQWPNARHSCCINHHVHTLESNVSGRPGADWADQEQRDCSRL